MCEQGSSNEEEGDDVLLPGLATIALELELELELAEDEDAFEAIEVSVPPRVESLQFKE